MSLGEYSKFVDKSLQSHQKHFKEARTDWSLKVHLCSEKNIIKSVDFIFINYYINKSIPQTLIIFCINLNVPARDTWTLLVTLVVT